MSTNAFQYPEGTLVQPGGTVDQRLGATMFEIVGTVLLSLVGSTRPEEACQPVQHFSLDLEYAPDKVYLVLYVLYFVD